MNRTEGFLIDDGVLTGYKGTDTDLVIPNNVTCIGEGAFRWEYRLKQVTLPDSITKIENFAFSECVALEHVNIPDGVLSIGDRAFAGCFHLCDLEIPESVKNIGKEAFLNCSYLKIHCRACSYAEKCAKAAGISVICD